MLAWPRQCLAAWLPGCLPAGSMHGAVQHEGGGVGPCARCVRVGKPHDQFFFNSLFNLKFFLNIGNIGTISGIKMLMKSLPLAVRPRIEATEARLESIYKAALMGLKGDSLALASGMLPVEYRQLCQFDPLAELAAQKGRADSELRHAMKLNEASENGDAKASLAILQHVHGWTAKTEISVDVYQKISILTALEQARSRVSEGLVIDV